MIFMKLAMQIPFQPGCMPGNQCITLASLLPTITSLSQIKISVPSNGNARGRGWGRGTCVQTRKSVNKSSKNTLDLHFEQFLLISVEPTLQIWISSTLKDICLNFIARWREWIDSNMHLIFFKKNKFEVSLLLLN